MLRYHPAYDPYHAAFRFLRLLKELDEPKVPVLTVRILDFFLLFPAEVETMVMPAQWRSWRLKFRDRRNKYFSSVTSRAAFMQLAGPQREGFRLLVSRGLIDPEQFESDHVALIVEKFPSQLAATIDVRNAEEPELVDLLVSKLATLDLLGPKGLKQRTGLAEYRYDAI